jgi:7,8-dihydropterin-6-yl-methyl-4-(beta-D-ribofuranosyl)aminobenzene 5'-phosphate synthase
MSRLDDLGEVKRASVTVLVDNRADLLVKSSDAVKRFTKRPLLAEHGFAALIELEGGVRVLWDAGITQIALLENMKQMEIDPRKIDKIALSHGHGDHTAAVTEVLRAVGGQPEARKWDKDTPLAEVDAWVKEHHVPLVAHPAVFRERWGVRRDGSRYGPNLPPPRAEWEAAGAEIVLSEGPYKLGPGCATTGAVPRLSFEKAGTPSALRYREGDALVRDYMEDDQALFINVRGKGLVVVAGCAHAGIVNTVKHAQEISGVDQVWAVLGGFHLASASDEDVQRTIDELEKLEPTMVVPSHCTGFSAISQFAGRMPDQFVLGAVGTTYLF